jgi:MFS family permease
MTDIAERAGPLSPARTVALHEWRQGWLLVLVSLLGYAVATVPTYSLGVFMASIQNEFGWSRAEISASLLVYSIVAVVCSPFAGLLIDRTGVRWVGIGGMSVFCAAFALLALIGPSIWAWWSIWFLIALGGVFIKPTLWATAISKQFSIQRGVALAVFLCGSGLSSAVFPSISHWLIDSLGWRGAYLAIAGCAAATMLPFMALCFRQSATEPRAIHEQDAAPPSLRGYSVRDSMLSYRFSAIAIPTLLMTSATIGTVVHFVPIMTGAGMTVATATAMTGIIGTGTIVGRLGTGFLLDKFQGSIIGAISFFLPIIPIGLLISEIHGTGISIITAVLIGLSVGSEVDIVAYITSRYFGLRNYGTIFGTLIGIMALGAGVGPTLAGLAYDLSGSYHAFFWALLPCLALSSALIGSLGKYPDFDAAEA